MCGIAGYRVISGQVDSWAAGLPGATQALHHRGPDDGDVWYSSDRSVGLGHRRLSILDLSSAGHQPMTSACGRWVMVFNGEVYNFREIRAELEPLGYHFQGSGDSEVILAAAAQWGLDAVTRFIGMFAIALWHKPTGELHLVRDRLGVKPLYYSWDGRVLAFGSELKALRAFSGTPGTIDPQSMVDSFRYSYIADPRTIYDKVFQLQPAHRLCLKSTGAPEITRYWNVQDHAIDRSTRSEADLEEELESLMVSAFKYRMIADVPVGVFLSGGLDSSLVAALLQKHSTQQIRTFTIGFHEQEFNEAPFAEAVARHIGTDHTTRILDSSEAMRMLPSWGDLYDEPFGDSSGLPTLLVSRVAAEEVKVVLSADGGDEMFSGYGGHTAMLAQMGKLAGIPLGVRRAANSVLSAVPWRAADDKLAAMQWPGELNHRLREAVTIRFDKINERLSSANVGEIYDSALARFSDPELQRLLGVEPIKSRAHCGVFAGNDGEKLCLWDLHNYLPSDVLTKVDRATMAVSIEGREPLLDHRLVEFAFSLPFDLRRGALGTKHLLRKVLYRHVPQALLDRPKRGFSVPVRKWLGGEMKDLLDQYLNPSRISQQGLLNPREVALIVKRFRAGDVLSTDKIWLLLAFQMWHERWMAPASLSRAA